MPMGVSRTKKKSRLEKIAVGTSLPTLMHLNYRYFRQNNLPEVGQRIFNITNSKGIKVLLIRDYFFAWNVFAFVADD